MAVVPGQMLTMLFWLEGSIWHQRVLDEATGKSVSFAIDMKGQAQTEVLFELESWGSPPVEGVEFLDSEFTMRNSEPDACRSVGSTPIDFISTPTVDSNGGVCRVGRIVMSLSAPVPVAVSSATCKDQSHTKSLNATTPVKANFVNHHGSPVSLYWLDYSGNAKSYGMLTAGQELQLSTFVTHPWMIIDSSQKCLGIYVAASGNDTFEIR